MTALAARRWRLLPATVLSVFGLLLAACVATGKPAVSSVAAEPTATAVTAASSRRYLRLGAAHLAGGEPRLAYDAFMTSIRVEGLTAEALVGAGIASEKQGMLTAARRHFEQAIEIEPESIAAHNNLGVALFLLKEYYPARDAFRVAFALSSGRNGIAERNLNRAEAVVAQIEKPEKPDPAISHRVVRLGTSEFRITPLAETSAEMMGAE